MKNGGVAGKIELATEERARLAHSQSRLDLARYGYGIPSNLTMVGDAVDDAIDGVLPYPAWRNRWEKEFTEGGDELARRFAWPPMPFLDMVKGRWDRLEGGTSILDSLIYRADPAPGPIPMAGMPVIISPYVPKGIVRMIGSTVYANDVRDVVDAVKRENSGASSYSGLDSHELPDQ